MIRRLGILEYIITTPSNHRVHHDRRVHKNFAGVFIIWDIMFGTFLDEYEDVRDNLPNPEEKTDLNKEERMRFGVSFEIESWNESVF
jgi:sterol desaturase/sphingolipid hydroxylase (fatty acid hydroxylase superfamily)